MQRIGSRAITVERKRSFSAPLERIRAVLTDIDQLERLIPRAERVEVLARNEQRARVSVFMRISRLPLQRIEGEARLLDDGVRFIAVQPMQIDARYQLQARDTTTEVLVRLVTEVPKALSAVARLIPQRMIEERIGAELEAALNALEAAVNGQQHV